MNNLQIIFKKKKKLCHFNDDEETSKESMNKNKL